MIPSRSFARLPLLLDAYYRAALPLMHLSSFPRPALPFREGEITAEARIIYKGSKTALGDVEIRNTAGDLIAKGLATYMIGPCDIYDHEKQQQS